jgi:hypothetical protein
MTIYTHSDRHYIPRVRRVRAPVQPYSPRAVWWTAVAIAAGFWTLIYFAAQTVIGH